MSEGRTGPSYREASLLITQLKTQLNMQFLRKKTCPMYQRHILFNYYVNSNVLGHVLKQDTS